MMKIIFTGILLSTGCFTAVSQAVSRHTFAVGAGLNLAIPVYNLDISSPGGGADVMVQYGLSDKTGITADVAFIGLPGKDNYPSTAIVPVRLGVRYFPAQKLYLHAKAGLGIYTILKASASHAAFSIGGGYFINKKIETAVFYDGFTNKNSSFGYMGIRAGYNF